MMHEKLKGTTDASGDLTVTSDRLVNGLLFSVDWIDGDLADNNTAVLSIVDALNETERTLLTLGAGEGDDDASYYPRVLEHDNECTALSTYTYQVVYGYLKLVIASGGNAKEGGCVVHYFE